MSHEPGFKHMWLYFEDTYTRSFLFLFFFFLPTKGVPWLTGFGQALCPLILLVIVFGWCLGGSGGWPQKWTSVRANSDTGVSAESDAGLVSHCGSWKGWLKRDLQCPDYTPQSHGSLWPDWPLPTSSPSSRHGPSSSSCSYSLSRSGSRATPLVLDSPY